MDTLLSVLSTLGVDQSLWTQFFITLIFLFIVRLVFVNDLMRVLSERVLNTSGALDEAEKLNASTDAAKKRYEKILNEQVVTLNNDYSLERKKIKESLETEYKNKEEKIVGEYKKKTELQKLEFQKLQEVVEKGAVSLSTDLLNKIKQ